MPNSPTWSSGSAQFPPAEAVAGRFDWRPSRWLIAALWLLGGCGAISLLASDMARGFAWPTAFAAMSWSLWTAWRESRRSRRVVAVSADGRVEIDGEHARDFRVEWRGMLAFGRWVDGSGRTHRLVWWPDTLPPARARELRLAMPVETAPRLPR